MNSPTYRLVRPPEFDPPVWTTSRTLPAAYNKIGKFGSVSAEGVSLVQGPPRFEHRLFLSATPHNGHSNSFSALLEILDPQRFCRGVKVTKQNRDDVIVRRIKEDLREIQGGFPKRNVDQITLRNLPADAPEIHLASLLSQYQDAREQRLATKS